MFTTKPGTMFSTSSMTFVLARTISNSPVSVPAFVTTKVTGPDGTVIVAGEQPDSLTDTATRPADGAAEPDAPPLHAAKATAAATRSMAEAGRDGVTGRGSWVESREGGGWPPGP